MKRELAWSVAKTTGPAGKESGAFLTDAGQLFIACSGIRSVE
ncbi:hypothetical protein [Endozoicomonas sp. SCSIO W0465]|nr:hypothetical protein [Endozoicomonas sp. SCSIO W0465]